MTPFTSRGTATRTPHTPSQSTSPAKRLRAAAPFPARRRLRTSRFLLRSTAGCALLRCVGAGAAPSGSGRSRPRLPFPSVLLSPAGLEPSRCRRLLSPSFFAVRGCAVGPGPLAAVLRSGGGAGLRRSGTPRLRAAAPGLRGRRSFCSHVKVF